jgi:hypothetical protein
MTRCGSPSPISSDGLGAGLCLHRSGDTERNPRDKMRAYMRDGCIPNGWRIDIPNRCVELWEPSNVEQPIASLRGSEVFGFEGVTFTVDGTFAILESPK